MSFEPKTKFGKKAAEILSEIDNVIKDSVATPEVKEGVNIAINFIETAVKATPSKVDDIIVKAVFAYLRARYKI